MINKTKTTSSKATKAATVRKPDGKAKKEPATNSSKKEWLQIHIQCSVNTDNAPKWLREKMDYLKRNGLNDEQVNNVISKTVDNLLTEYAKEISKKGLTFGKFEIEI